MKLFQSILVQVSILVSIVSSDSIKTSDIPFDLNGSNFTYPWPVKVFQFTGQRSQPLEMVFMDIAPNCGLEKCVGNGKTAVLLHGRNFCGPTWNVTATVLSSVGYRVILPDQVGFCKSSKPDIYQYSLQQLAANTLALLKILDIEKVTLLGHSMGGMLGTRFSLMYPANVTELVLVNPIGLEDWKAKGVPYISTDTTWATEAATTYTSIRNYQQSTYYVGKWEPSYDTWVNMLVNIYQGSMASLFAWNQALIVDMVLTQPVIYEFPLLKVKTLLLIGEKDTTAIGKPWSPPEVQAVLGHYAELGPQAAAMIPGSTLITFPDLGHAPQLSEPEKFHNQLLGWLLIY